MIEGLTSLGGMRVKKSGVCIMLVWLTLVMLAGAVFGQAQQGTAELKNAGGNVVGTATFTQQSDGARVLVQVNGLPSGKHGIHIHAVAKCDPPNFTSAGSHFNPAGKHHGLLNPDGPHAGDLPNLEVATDGTGRLDYTNSLVTLAAGPANSLFKPNGTSLVIHANSDDEISDTAGKSGPRIACGAILAVSAQTFLEQYALSIATVVTIVVVVVIAAVAIRRRKPRTT